MATVTIYGASDDLAEIEGDFTGEFDADSRAAGVWVFSTGTMITMGTDDDGNWILENVTSPDVLNADEISFGRRPDRPDWPDMSATVTGDFTEVMWFKYAPKMAKRIGD